MQSVYDALDPIVNSSVSEKEKGTKYEAACVWFLDNDPYWSQRFSRVGTLEQALNWEDCPIHDTQDTGIDLVAQDTGTEEWWAIQCKCYDDEKPLPKGVCDSFYARALGDPAIDHYMIMTTAKGIAKNLKQQIDNTDTMLVDTAKMETSHLDWGSFIYGVVDFERETYDPRPHQKEAINAIKATFAENDRCKAIMACGTGKTLMSLRLTEDYLNGSGTVLFCAPSISLVGQSMREWLSQSRVKLSPLVVCSDAKASRREDAIPMTLDSFEYPATTRPDRLVEHYKASRKINPDGLVVIFSTYQSIDVIHQAQELGIPEFDLIICDEAHRTTGSALPGVSKQEASSFMKVHYNENVSAKKRLYMTATPRIYGETAKRKGAEEDFTIASMDDESLYGPVAYQIKFGEAVEKKLLTDYKVLVLTVEEDALGEHLLKMDDQGVNARTLEPSDIGKIIGCWKGLAEHGENAPEDALGLDEMLVIDDMNSEPTKPIKPLKRAVGFCQTINASKTICEAFSQTIDKYKDEGEDFGLKCELKHVDGTMNSQDRNRNIAWLGEEVPDGECRILTNARCLAEGIDVPNLDAVIFFNAKNSTVDVVQAVGRVMRVAKGKDFGYIILPIFVPAGMTPEEALDDSKVFANVWSILQALRSHDERIEARVNALALEQAARKNKPDINKDRHKGWDDSLTSKKEIEEQKAAEIAHGVQMRLSLFPVERWEKAVRTQLVKKCGTRIYWDEWADDVAKIAQRHIERIDALVKSNDKVGEKFQVFLTGLRDSLNPGISEEDAVEMVAQHMITVPVFDALFGDFEFAKSNPVSIAIESFLSIIKEHRVEEASDAEVLEDVYASVRRRAAMVRTDTARQQLIRDLYERFFKVAFKGTSDKMGVVYTPSEIIEYILRETDRVLKREFGKSLSDEGVHILDPFAGTGSFIAELIESDLIPNDKLEQKYKHEMHSNEILLLAYYIMTVNIEYAYHARMGGGYAPFEGAVLTDTFQMTEEGDTLDTKVFTQNSERVLKQNELPIRVIVGNPPYSIGQRNENDNNANENYPFLDESIRSTYVARSDAKLSKGVYDSYIRAFRWATNRLNRAGDRGIICFVTNAGWLEASATDGMRRCFVDEFNSIHVFHLRGNQRTQGEESRKEGGKVFGSGSRAPIAITMLVKNPDSKEQGKIYFHNIGDYLTREEKLTKVKHAAVYDDLEWTEIIPDKHGDWINQRDDSWYDFAPVVIDKCVEKKASRFGIFELFSYGVVTNRDAWAYNFSQEKLKHNMTNMLEFFNEEQKRMQSMNATKKQENLLSNDSTKIKWTRRLKDYCFNGRNIQLEPCWCVSMYRPFCKQWLYFNMELNEMTCQQTRLFPFALSEWEDRGRVSKPYSSLLGEKMTYQQNGISQLPNLVIQVTGVGSKRDFSCLMSSVVPDLQTMENGQSLAFYWYEEQESLGGLFESQEKKIVRHETITDEALQIFKNVYPKVFDAYGKQPVRAKKYGGVELNKEDIFFYIYGVLHSSEYRERFASNLKKELPRIPFAEDFVRFCNAGRALAELHLNYESVEPYPSIIEEGSSKDPGRTEKIRFGKCKKDDDHPKGEDKTVLYVSENLVLKNIPERAYDYVVNGKSAIGWLIDRYQVRTDKASGIVNDPNDYSEDPRYIVDLVKRVVTVSMETLEIVGNLPPLNEKPQPANWPFAWKVDGGK